MRIFASAALTAVTLLLAGTALAQDKYPSRPVKLVVPFVPGGQTDITARLISNHISQSIGQPVIVENRSGAGGSIGAEIASKAAPDGYTLLLATSSTHSTNPYVYPKLGYHPIDSFTPIAQISIAPMALAVHASQPIASSLFGVGGNDPIRSSSSVSLFGWAPFLRPGLTIQGRRGWRLSRMASWPPRLRGAKRP